MTEEVRKGGKEGGRDRGKEKENSLFISQYSEIFQFLQDKINAREPQFYF